MKNLNIFETSQETSMRGNRWLLWSIFLYFIMNGAQLWETALFAPTWTSNPPESLDFLRKTQGVGLPIFWIFIHSIHEVFMLIALVYNWKFRQRRNWMLLLILIHVGIRVWTLVYFAPAIMEFQTNDISGINHQDLLGKTEQWRNLNYLRVSLYFLVNLGFVQLLVQPKFIENDV